jgi:hypothetical protein
MKLERTVRVCQLANIQYQWRGPLRADPRKEDFLNEMEANQAVHRDYRDAWKKVF